MRQQLVDVVIDDNFVKCDPLPAEGTVRPTFKTVHAFLAHCMMHGADDDGLLVAAVVVTETYVALVDVAKFLVDRVLSFHRLTIIQRIQ